MNKLLLVGDKFMPEIHLKQPGFTYSACGPFTKNKERIEKFMQTGNTDFIYRNELDKACFQHNMAYGKSKDLAKRTQSDKFLRDKAFKIANDPKYDNYQRGLASMVYKFFDKKSSRSGVGTSLTNKSATKPNYQLANEFHISWFVPLKDEGETTIVNAFQDIISKGCKPNKIWVDQGGEFYNNFFKRF